MARLIWIAAVILPAASGQPVHIEYRTLPKPEIERRLYAYEDSNDKREQKLRQWFEEAGCNGEHLTEQAVKHVKSPNLICSLPGQLDSEIVVGAHFDFVNAGRGVVDNWSGCSLLPSLYLDTRGVPRRHRFVFIAFTGEELGLVGSQFYVRQLGKEGVAKISAMVNLDSLGTTATKLELDRGDRKLANALAIIASNFKLPLNVVNVHRVGRSDSDSFEDRHVPSINIHSLTNQTFPVLHSIRDQISAIQLDAYYDSYRLVSVYLAYLDLILDRPESGEERK